MSNVLASQRREIRLKKKPDQGEINKDEEIEKQDDDVSEITGKMPIKRYRGADPKSNSDHDEDSEQRKRRKAE